MGAQSRTRMVWERTDDAQGGLHLGCSQGLGDARLGGINCPQISKWRFLSPLHLLFIIKETYAYFKQV